MEIAKLYITDEKGSVKSVVIDYEIFQRLEEALLDKGLLEAMKEIEDEPAVSVQEMKSILLE